MKAIWFAEDIITGQRYFKPGTKEVWIIGYRPDLDGVTRFVSISLEDGMVTSPETREQIAECLTKNEYLPIELKALGERK